MNKRWYDSHEDTLKALEVLKKLDRESRKKLANDIIEISNQIKALHKEEEEPPLSLGLERVLGLYQTVYARRWYDRNADLSNAIKNISTLPKEDFLNIMEGLNISLSI